MPRRRDLWDRRLEQFKTPRPPVPIIGSKLDQITANKNLKGNLSISNRKKWDRRDFLLWFSVGLGVYSGVKLYEGFFNPTSNMQTGENVLKEPEIVNEVFELMSDSEKAVLNTALFDFFNTFGIQEVDIRIIDSMYKDSEFPQEIYASPGELQLDMGLIRANASSKGLLIEDYFRLTLLDSLSQVIQDRGDVRLPETTEVYLDEGYRLLGYKGFGALVDVGGGQVGYFSAPNVAFQSAFANAVDPRYRELFGNQVAIDFIDRLLNHYGISMGEALDLNRGHGMDHLLLRMFRDRTQNESGEPALTIEDIDEFLMYFEEANRGEVSADELFERYLRIANIDEQ